MEVLNMAYAALLALALSLPFQAAASSDSIGLIHGTFALSAEEALIIASIALRHDHRH